MKASERLLKYAVIYTGSDEDHAEQTPSTPEQMTLAQVLAKDMRDIGLTDVSVDAHAYVYGFLPATAGREQCPPIGFIAHIDIVNEFGTSEIHPQIVKEYDGGEIALGTSGRTLDTVQFPDLKQAIGKTVITTDGTTVLGADDKAGVAEILTMCERLVQDNLPHGKICVCFTPDEEIGHGAALLDLEKFGASYAYTVDGGAPNEVEWETFYAAAADWSIAGVSVHPGDAKDKMVNAALVAMEINGMLPPDEIPAKTQGREGFFHLCDMSGDVSAAKLSYIIRDHDAEKFSQRKQTMREIERKINETYGAGTAALTLREQYRNMAEILQHHPDAVEQAKRAIRAVGLTPVSNPVRGGTDGAQLSFRGLPCPNLGTGAYALHGPYEHAIAEQMDVMTEILLHIAQA
ncbi:peptidase T [Butyricicoccus intestinisimiae]|uniref:Peptidase T n=1 Tax=Butyricicoccus intestinisimiae TaxID=2841509 RepID=A0ABS6ETX3_9FIRM|nr:peptidase T [Butyricicoccus intestinisimiae]MBU5491144.1 peptidase T [Butyricicoccus intestinisimiae]